MPSELLGVLKSLAKDRSMKGFAVLGSEQGAYFKVFQQPAEADLTKPPTPLGVIQLYLRFLGTGAEWVDMEGKPLIDVEAATRQAISQDPKLSLGAFYRITD